MINLKKLLENKLVRLGLAFIAFWIPAVIFAKLAGEIVEREPIEADVAILQFIHSLANPVLDTFFLTITTLGNVEVIFPLALGILIFLLYKNMKGKALFFTFAVGGAAIANLLLKTLFQRDRPSLWDSAIVETSFSFPSGHAMMSAALVFTLIYLLRNSKWRNLSLWIGIPFFVLISISRLYMGVHYPTDILAGWTVSFLWVFIVVVISKRSKNLFKRPPQPAES